MNNPTLVVVTDRNDLDGQLFEQFCSAKDLLKQTPEQADSRDQLREMLAARQSGGIIFTTVQKFSLLDGEGKHPPLCQRNNVVVISDEAHRSQYGLQAKLVKVRDKETKQVIGSRFVYGFAKHMRDALPGASFIGFTGTPISLEDKDTIAVFGNYVSVYDIQDAKDDGATVPIYYESRLAKLDINRAAIDALNKEVEEVVEDEEDDVAREAVKSKWTQLAKLVGAQPRLAEVAQDLVAHFETRTATLEGKGMFVAMSREICVDLFDEIIRLRPQWAGTQLRKEGKDVGYNPEDGAIRIIMTGAASDRSKLQPHVFTKAQKKRLERRFKEPADPLKLVIVRDMWLTGFDAPCCHTMYVDKPMVGHNLMQAIARVNRVFKDKPGGLVVDYIGIAAELRKYHNRAIETAQVIEALIAMAKDFQAALKRNEELNLSRDEVAFYDALAERPEVLEQMGDATLKQLATELTEKLRASTAVDWQHRESVRAKMRLLIKRLLRKYKYPPEGQEAAVTLVLQQAEALADTWSAAM